TGLQWMTKTTKFVFTALLAAGNSLVTNAQYSLLSSIKAVDNMMSLLFLKNETGRRAAPLY
ncbi:hypothetical protein Q6247_25425, partial [Klebsiella pneumoniae]